MKKVRGIACLIGGVFLGSLGAIEMVDVPAGRFKRGKQEVEIRNQYRMGKYPITRQEFKEICGQDPSEEESSSGKEAPVQNVNWYQAISFCNKLSLKEGLEEVYQVEDVDFKELSFKDIPVKANHKWNKTKINWQAQGYRLPSEMEWMWAAMGAKETEQDSTKAFAGSKAGEKSEDYLWYYENAAGKSQNVGQKQTNELGLHDMSGNVWEWCGDYLENFPPDEILIDYTGPEMGVFRVRRGGSWKSNILDNILINREASLPWERSEAIGFRVVLGTEVPQAPPEIFVEEEIQEEIEVPEQIQEEPKPRGYIEGGGALGTVFMGDAIGLNVSAQGRYIFGQEGLVFGLGGQLQYLAIGQKDLQHHEIYAMLLGSLDIPLYRQFALRSQLSLGGGLLCLQSTHESAQILGLLLFPEIGPLFTHRNFRASLLAGPHIVIVPAASKFSPCLSLGITWIF